MQKPEMTEEKKNADVAKRTEKLDQFERDSGRDCPGTADPG
jgi:hypothetical protein